MRLVDCHYPGMTKGHLLTCGPPKQHYMYTGERWVRLPWLVIKMMQFIYKYTDE